MAVVEKRSTRRSWRMPEWTSCTCRPMGCRDLRTILRNGAPVGSAVGSAVAVREASLVAVTAAEVAEKGLVVAEICLEATVDQGARMATDSTAAGSVVGWVAVAPQAERVVQTAG